MFVALSNCYPSPPIKLLMSYPLNGCTLLIHSSLGLFRTFTYGFDGTPLPLALQRLDRNFNRHTWRNSIEIIVSKTCSYQPCHLQSQMIKSSSNLSILSFHASDSQPSICCTSLCAATFVCLDICSHSLVKSSFYLHATAKRLELSRGYFPVHSCSIQQ